MKRFFNLKAEVLRLRFLYRRLILEGRVTLSPEHAVKLVGPDCAFHLYRVKFGSPRSSKEEARGSAS